MNKIKLFITTHKFISSLIGLALILFVYYRFFKTTAVTTQYGLATVQQGTVISSISGTGQVSASNQVDIKPKVTGTITYVTRLLPGAKVAAGTLLVQIDPTDAQKAVRNAQLDLQTAQLSLTKLQYDQANGQYTTSDTLTNDQTNLTKAYQDGFNNVATAFIHLPSNLNDTRLVLYGTQLVSYGCQPDYCAYDNLLDPTDRSGFDVLVTGTINNYITASVSYTQALNDYKNTSRSDSNDKINTIISESLVASQDLSQAMKSETTMLATLISDIQKGNKTVPSAVTNYQTTLLNDLTTVNSQISTLLASQNTITTSNQSLAADQRNVGSTTQSNSLDLQTQTNNIAQKQVALEDAQTTLAEYSIRAPFSGILGAVNANVGDDASSGTAVATVVTPQQVVEISLNEIDIAKIQVGQQATLTFDALPNLTLTGKVVSVDVIGAVTQGVVSYTVKIAFDTNNDQVLPGMSVSAAIITQAKPDVVEVPNSAIKTQGGQSYVQVVKVPSSLIPSGTATVVSTALTSAPQNQPVTIGIASDTMTEIVSGLNVGDVVVTRTITGATTATTATSATSGLRIPGLTGGAAGGGGFGGGTGAGRTTTTTGR